MGNKFLAVLAVGLLLVGSIACDENNTINPPSGEDIFLAEVAVAVLSVVEDINAIKLIVPEEEDPAPSVPGGAGEPDPNEGCEIIQNSTLFYCNEDGDIRDCGDGRYRFNACTNQPPDLSTTKTVSNGELVIGENEIWPTGGINMFLETPLSAATHDMTFDGTSQVVTQYSQDMVVTHNCAVTLDLVGGLIFEAVATCEESD